MDQCIKSDIMINAMKSWHGNLFKPAALMINEMHWLSGEYQRYISEMLTDTTINH